MFAKTRNWDRGICGAAEQYLRGGASRRAAPGIAHSAILCGGPGIPPRGRSCPGSLSVLVADGGFWVGYCIGWWSQAGWGDCLDIDVAFGWLRGGLSVGAEVCRAMVGGKAWFWWGGRSWCRFSIYYISAFVFDSTLIT